MTSFWTRASALALVAAAVGSPVAAQTASSTVDELVVTGQRASQQKAIAAKRNAIGVVDAISSDDIGRLADKNVAENLERLPGVGATAAADTYNDRYERLDLKASYAINDQVEVFMEAQNLADTKLRQYIGVRRDWITNYERLRQTYAVGVSAKW